MTKSTSAKLITYAMAALTVRPAHACGTDIASLLIRGPTVLANQWHKLAGAMFFDLIAGFRLDHAHQTLRLARFANRNYQTTTDLQLRDQGIGHAWSTSRDQNSIVRCMCVPAERAVKSLDRRIVDPKFAYAGLRFARQLADALNRVNLGRELSQNCGLITRPSTDFQHSAFLVQLKQLCHPRYDERLRNRLIGIDW